MYRNIVGITGQVLIFAIFAVCPAKDATAGDRDLPFADWSRLGVAGLDGILRPEDFRTEPSEFLVAGDDAGVGGPVPFDPAGTVIRLGDG